MLSLKDRLKRSIKFRSLLIMATIITMIQLISTITSVFINYSNLQQSFFQRINLLTSFQADALSNPIWDFNNKTVRDILDTFVNEPSFIYVAIYDANNKISSSVGVLSEAEETMIISSPIIYEPKDKLLGKLELQVSLRSLHAKVWEDIYIGGLQFIILQFLILGITYWVLSGVMNPIQTITRVVNSIKDGKLDNNILGMERLDEMGAIANAVNSLQTSTKDMNESRQQIEKEKTDRQNKVAELIEEFFANSSNVIKSVEKSSNELDQTSQQMSGIIKDVDQKAYNVNDISQRTSKNIQNVATATGGMNEAIEEISMQITKSTNVVHKSVKATEEARVISDTLDEAMKQIGEVVLFIGNIAKQVNMLALNATIEAARAGPAGKGFAVVASEVKSLAHQTSSATEDINNKITNIQDASNQVIKSMMSIKDSIANVNEYSAAVASAVEEQHLVTKDIFTNMNVAADGVKDMSNNISDIKLLTSNADESTMDVLEASKVLQTQADLLTGTINKFVEEIRKI
jgi:methyl-accepting chemotaxis protein